MNKDTLKSKKRYELIDSIRGFAIINMVIFHTLYDIFMIYGDGSFFTSPWCTVWERFICVSFIIISGVSFNFSNHTVRNGIIVSLCGFVVTAVTAIAIPSQVVWFGILNLLGISMLICSALKDLFNSIPTVVGAILSFMLYAVTYGVPTGYIGFLGIPIIELPSFLYEYKYLSFLGFRSYDFVSSDYFSIIPWLFLFVFGIFLWRTLKKIKWDKYFYFKIPILNVIGRYSLIIYLLHQPVIMLIMTIIYGY